MGLLALFPLGPHTLTGLLLCIEAGGRVHVEGVADSDCAATDLLAQWEAHPVHPLAAATSATQWQRVDETAPCIDVPLLLSPTDGYGQLARGQAVVLAVAAGMLWIPWHLASNQTPLFHLSDLSSRFPRFTAPLRTVILRL